MNLRRLFGLAAIACLPGKLLATSCSVPPPCARVRPNSILFVGVVIDSGVPKGSKEDSEQDARLQVEEIFAGLPPSVKEVVVTTEGAWLQKGHTFLIDAYRGADGHYYPATCGASDEVTSPSTLPVLDYLRQRSLGKTKTLLTINVTDGSKPVSDAEVTITSSKGALSSKTGPEGRAAFDEIASGTYVITAKLEQYHLDTESRQDNEVEVLAGTCEGAQVVLKAETEVSGFVRDSKVHLLLHWNSTC